MIEEQARVARDNPETLKRWLVESGRRWILLDALELVDALSWPDGVEDFQRIIGYYRDHRATIPTGRTERQLDSKGNESTFDVMKGEVLEPKEKLALLNDLMAELISDGFSL